VAIVAAIVRIILGNVEDRHSYLQRQIGSQPEDQVHCSGGGFQCMLKRASYLGHLRSQHHCQYSDRLCWRRGCQYQYHRFGTI